MLRATCYSLILNSIIWSLPWESGGHECIASKLYIVPHNTHQSVAELFVVSQKHQALVLKSTKFLLAIFPLQTFLMYKQDDESSDSPPSYYRLNKQDDEYSLNA